jgi:hypothetical protein
VSEQDRVDVPKVWQQIGFSGLFHQEATLNGVEDLDAFEAKLPDRVPFGTNSGWLALRLNRDQDPPTVTVVRNDWAAVSDLVTMPRLS